MWNLDFSKGGYISCPDFIWKNYLEFSYSSLIKIKWILILATEYQIQFLILNRISTLTFSKWNIVWMIDWLIDYVRSSHCQFLAITQTDFFPWWSTPSWSFRSSNGQCNWVYPPSCSFFFYFLFSIIRVLSIELSLFKMCLKEDNLTMRIGNISLQFLQSVWRWGMARWSILCYNFMSRRP